MTLEERAGGFVEWQLDRQKAALGRAIYPFRQSGQVEVQADLPEVREVMTRIETLQNSLDARRAAQQRRTKTRRGGRTTAVGTPGEEFLV